MQNKRFLLAKLILVLASVFIALLILEGLLRFMGLHTPVLYCPDKQTGYDLRPNQDVSVLRNHIQVNDTSFRDARDLLARHPRQTTIRIGVFGDSVTWGGVRIEQDDLFTSRLERLLADACPGASIEVYNGGVNGYSTKQAVDKAGKAQTQVGFDLILMYLIERNFHRNPYVVLQRDALPFPQSARASAVWQAFHRSIIIMNQKLRGALFDPPRATAITRELDDESVLQANTDALLTFQADMLRKNVPVVVFLSPRKTLLTGDTTQFKALAEALAERMPFVESLLDSFRSRGDAAADYYYDHVHLNSHGHEFVSRRIAAYLREAGIAGRSGIVNPAPGYQTTGPSASPAQPTQGP